MLELKTWTGWGCDAPEGWSRSWEVAGVRLEAQSVLPLRFLPGAGDQGEYILKPDAAWTLHFCLVLEFLMFFPQKKKNRS